MIEGKQREQIAIIGLGYVGLPLAVEFGKIRPVIGFDINASRIAELQDGVDNTQEVSTEEMAAATYLTLSSDPGRVVVGDHLHSYRTYPN